MAEQGASNHFEKLKNTRTDECPDNQKFSVPISSPNARLLIRQCNIANFGQGATVSRHWMTTSLALNVVFISVLLCQRNHNVQFTEWGADESMNSLSWGCLATLQAIAASDRACSGHGYHEYDVDSKAGGCRCHSCFTGSECTQFLDDCVINLDHGDPKMFENFWIANRDTTTTIILGWQRMSYFANTKDACWFLEPQLAKEIRILHRIVGNAITTKRHIIVGTGSTQLFHAALFALSATKGEKSLDVVSAVPFYSSYPLMTDYLQSGAYSWAGDASSFKPNLKSTYIELVTSPNNPDGTIRQAIVNGTGSVIYDMAYYWPHFTPVNSPADHDIMLFSVSKSTGHAGTRIGWALVKDSDVAKKMVKFVELNTIGVSKDSQLRAAQILNSITHAYTHKRTAPYKLDRNADGSLIHRSDYHSYLFHYGYAEMESRWRRLRAVIDGSELFSVGEFPPAFCSFFGEETIPHPAFAWILCKKQSDCHALFKAEGILTRSGIHFGAGSQYVRLSMLDRSAIFDVLIDRLSRIKPPVVILA